MAQNASSTSSSQEEALQKASLDTAPTVEAERDARIRQLQNMAGEELARSGAGLAYDPAFAAPQPLPVGSTAPDQSMQSIVPDSQVVARGVTADGRAWKRWDSGATTYAVDLHLDMEPGRELGPLSKVEVDALRNGASSQGGGFLANARAGMNAYWTQVADDGVSQGSFFKYATGQTMRALGNLGYDVEGMAVAAYDEPREGVIGGVKSLANLGPDLFNGAVNMTKLSLDGYSRIAEALGAGDGVRETNPYNITPLFAYDNQAQAGGGLITQTALGFGLEKYGDYNVRLNVDTSPTFYTGKPLFRLEAQNSAFDVNTVTVKDIPTFKSGGFNEWFDARTPDEIATMYEKPSLRAKIESGLRGAGGNHEMLMVAEAPQWSQWGVSAKMVQEDFAIPIADLNEGGLANGWRHSTGLEGSTAPGSKMVHNKLQDIIQNSASLDDFKSNIVPWAEKWIKGGYDALPRGFHQ
ncbi:hypothetical protein [Ralstonia pseudosolanacearum]|uniref:hypothetical protein n=1 Tax=Ralstonia pseudosolanacearum TaxID=1310165 RepID=UPI0039C5DC93